MASPELWKGLCCICCGTLTPENVLHQDCGDGRGGVHKGKCAYLYGLTAPEHQDLHNGFADLIRDAPTDLRDQCRKLYYRWLDTLGLEDYEEQFDG